MRGSRTAYDDPDFSLPKIGNTQWVMGSKHLILHRNGYRSAIGTTVNRQTDMNRPIGSALAIFLRTVQGVNDPDTSSRTALFIVNRFFRQNKVIRFVRGKSCQDQIVCFPIGTLTEFQSRTFRVLLHMFEEFARLNRNALCETYIIDQNE